MYPSHDKNSGSFPTRTVDEISDDIVRILTEGAHGSREQRKRAARLLAALSEHTPSGAPGEAHALHGLLSRCFDSMRRIANPFEPHADASSAIDTLHREFGPGIRDSCDELNERLSRLLRDVATRLVAGVPWETILQIGLDQSPTAPLVVTAQVLAALEDSPVWKKYLTAVGPFVEDRLRADLPSAIGAEAESVDELARETAEWVYPQNMGGGVPFKIWLTIARLAAEARWR